MVRLVQLVVVDQIRAVNVEQGAKGQAVVPAAGKVAHFDFFVTCRFALTPEEQSFFGAQPFFVDVADGEAQDQRPYQTEDDLAVAVDNVLRADVGQLYFASFDEVEGFVDVFEALDAEFGACGIAAQGFIGEDLEEVNENDL